MRNLFKILLIDENEKSAGMTEAGNYLY